MLVVTLIERYSRARKMVTVRNVAVPSDRLQTRMDVGHSLPAKPAREDTRLPTLSTTATELLSSLGTYRSTTNLLWIIISSGVRTETISQLVSCASCVRCVLLKCLPCQKGCWRLGALRKMYRKRSWNQTRRAACVDIYCWPHSRFPESKCRITNVIETRSHADSAEKDSVLLLG